MSPPKAYRIYIPSQWKKIVNQDGKSNEETWSSKSHEPPGEDKKREKLGVPYVNP